MHPAGVSDKRVACVLNTLNLGDIERINMVQRETEDGVAYQRVFIHFKEWFNNRDANAVRKKLVNIIDQDRVRRVSVLEGVRQSGE